MGELACNHCPFNNILFLKPAWSFTFGSLKSTPSWMTGVSFLEKHLCLGSSNQSSLNPGHFPGIHPGKGLTRPYLLLLPCTTPSVHPVPHQRYLVQESGTLKTKSRKQIESNLCFSLKTEILSVRDAQESWIPYRKQVQQPKFTTSRIIS